MRELDLLSPIPINHFRIVKLSIQVRLESKELRQKIWTGVNMLELQKENEANFSRKKTSLSVLNKLKYSTPQMKIQIRSLF